MLHNLLPNKHEQAQIQELLLLLVLRCRRLPLGRPPYSLGSVLALLAYPSPRSQRMIPTTVPLPQTYPPIPP